MAERPKAVMLHLLLTLQVATAPPATNTIAVVDVQRLLTESSTGKAATAKLNALRSEREKLLIEKQTAIDASGKQGAPAAQIQRMRIDFARLQEDAERDVSDLARSVEADFAKRLRPILQQILEEDHLGMIFEVPNPLLVWVSPSIDVTARVMTRLDADGPKK